MTIVKRKPVRRADVVIPWSETAWPRAMNPRRQALIGRIIALAAENGIEPEDAELLRREIEQAYMDEDVSELLDEKGARLSPESCKRVFRGRSPLMQWFERIEDLIAEKRKEA